MTREDNIFFAKRNIVDSIWKEANIEGISVTFPETQEIYEGRSIAGLTVDQIMAINNLKHAWEYLFETIGTPLNLEWIKGLNYKIGEGGVVSYAGDLRERSVGISGTDYRPEKPIESEVSERIDEIISKPPSDAALDIFSYLCRSQLFMDGNKRTAQLAANKIMIENGLGVLSIPIDKKLDFGNELIGFYESGDSKGLKNFLNENCISGF